MVTRVLEIGGNSISIGKGGKHQTQIEYYGLSTDNKPTKANNADIFYEMDTQAVYMFNEDSHEWLKQ